jgi:hypothetical protein
LFWANEDDVITRMMIKAEVSKNDFFIEDLL